MTDAPNDDDVDGVAADNLRKICAAFDAMSLADVRKLVREMEEAQQPLEGKA